MPFLMSSTQVLAHELSFASRMITNINFLGLVFWEALAREALFSTAAGKTHGSADVCIGVLPLSNSCRSLVGDRGSSSPNPSCFFSSSVACRQRSLHHQASLPHCRPPLWPWSFGLCLVAGLDDLRPLAEKRLIRLKEGSGTKIRCVRGRLQARRLIVDS